MSMVSIVHTDETREGFIYRVRVYTTNSGRVVVEKVQYGVLSGAAIRTEHATNGSRGRAFKYMAREQMEEALTVLVLRAMADPLNEPFLFADIPGIEA